MAHYYDHNANPVYQIPMSTKSGMRDTNLADAKKLKLLPGCTDIIGQADKDWLANWKVQQTLEAAVYYRNLEGHLPDNAWRALIYQKSKEVGDRTSKRGDEIHAQFEKTFTDGVIYDQDREFIEPVINELYKRYPKATWIAEESYAHKLGYGGRTDLHSKEGDIIIIDFKTKEKTKLDESVLYDAQRMQLAAGREGLNIPQAKCVNIFISTTNPSEPPFFYEWPEEKVQSAWKMFQNLLSYWQLKTGYNSAF